jgi:hypothetical protein
VGLGASGRTRPDGRPSGDDTPSLGLTPWLPEVTLYDAYPLAPDATTGSGGESALDSCGSIPTASSAKEPDESSPLQNVITLSP